MRDLDGNWIYSRVRTGGEERAYLVPASNFSASVKREREREIQLIN
jgi:hypothetical protein